MARCAWVPREKFCILINRVLQLCWLICMFLLDRLMLVVEDKKNDFV